MSGALLIAVGSWDGHDQSCWGVFEVAAGQLGEFGTSQCSDEPDDERYRPTDPEALLDGLRSWFPQLESRGDSRRVVLRFQGRSST